MVHDRIKLTHAVIRWIPRPLEDAGWALAWYLGGLLAFTGPVILIELKVLRAHWMVIASAAGFGVGAVMFSVGAWIANRGDYARAARSMRHGADCPQCWYDLASLAPEADGCVVCPECGAAWKLPAGEGVSEGA